MKNTIALLLIILPLLSFSQVVDTELAKEKEKSTIVSFQPIVFGVVSYNVTALGIGLTLEKSLENFPKIAYQIPFTLFLPQKNNFALYNNQSRYLYVGQGFSIAPALKFYPTGSNKPVSWGIGPAFRFSTVNEENYSYDTVTNTYVAANGSFFGGFEMQNSVNINISNLYFGVSNSIGVNYINPDYTTGIFLFSMSLGTRF